ncbi:TraB/GumN family protein [Alkalibacillus silvisoli]|uniref:TraB/GumN family protein n=1 Tax=Alkalibacillus silvisoli TaxID=392823 RepID=A0ABP3JU15_9BACI
MKHFKWYFTILIFSVLLSACSSDPTITFSDENLENAVLEELRLDEEIEYSDVEEVTELNLSNEGVEDLQGIEAFDGLEVLILTENEISDLSLVMDLQALEEITVIDNPLLEDNQQRSMLDELSEQGVTVIDEQQIGDPNGPGGFLWQVEHEGTTVYLQGTIHAGTTDFYPLHEKIETAYYEADVIVPEIDLNDVNMYEMQQTQQELGMYQDGTTIDEHISDELYEELEATIEELGMDMEMFASFKPWLLSSLIQSLRIQELGYLHGVDDYFLNQAVLDDKEVIALETVESQLDVLASPPEEYQITMLEDSIVNLDSFDEELTRMFELYKEGNQEELMDYLFDESVEPSEGEEAFMEALNDDRNYDMASQIDEFLQSGDEKTYFVIVGTAHLIVEPHIVSILEDEGYDVEHIH